MSSLSQADHDGELTPSLHRTQQQVNYTASVCKSYIGMNKLRPNSHQLTLVFSEMGLSLFNTGNKQLVSPYLSLFLIRIRRFL